MELADSYEDIDIHCLVVVIGDIAIATDSTSVWRHESAGSSKACEKARFDSFSSHNPALLVGLLSSIE